jgi:vacuolar-type H+-ATPase subunit H
LRTADNEEHSVPQLHDFLDRFRPAGAPGAAGRAAVPADHSRELETELLPVLALLDGTDTQCAGILAQAREDAEGIVAAARAEAAALLRDASQRAAAARADAVQHAVAAARAEAADAMASAHQQARQVAELAGQRVPTLASRAVDLIRDLGTGNRGPSGGWPDRRGESGWPT